MSLFSRIISIADDYDALTSSRVYHRVARSPEKVIRYMLSKAGRNYDPVLLKLFASVVGIFPVGTVLLLKSKEVAVVVKNKTSAGALDTPWVKVIVSVVGEEVDGVVVDTADPSVPARSILGVIDAAAVGMDLAGFFI